MNFTYDELSKLKYAASKLLEAVHQIEAVNITTGGNDILCQWKGCFSDSGLGESYGKRKYACAGKARGGW